mgnify:CR=1 FL=1
MFISMTRRKSLFAAALLFAIPALVAAKSGETRLRTTLAGGAIEVGIVGDFALDATIDAVARTLGALPARKAAAVPDELKKVSSPAAPFAKVLEKKFLTTFLQAKVSNLCVRLVLTFILQMSRNKCTALEYFRKSVLLVVHG